MLYSSYQESPTLINDLIAADIAATVGRVKGDIVFSNVIQAQSLRPRFGFSPQVVVNDGVTFQFSINSDSNQGTIVAGDALNSQINTESVLLPNTNTLAYTYRQDPSNGFQIDNSSLATATNHATSTFASNWRITLCCFLALTPVLTTVSKFHC